MSLYQNLPEDLHWKTIGLENKKDLYKQGLPRVSKKLYDVSIEKGQIIKTLENIVQICNYKSFDKKSLENQIKKLKEIYVKWLIWNNKPAGLVGRGIIGEQRKELLIDILKDLKIYWKNVDYQKYFSKIIEEIVFKDLMNRKTFINIILKNLIELNVKIRFCSKYSLFKNSIIADNITDKELKDLIIDIIKNVDFTEYNYNVLLKCIIELNKYEFIKKEPIDFIIYDTVKNNRKKICKFLYNNFFDFLLEYRIL